MKVNKIFITILVAALLILNGMATLDIKNYKSQIKGMEVEMNDQAIYINELEGEINDLSLQIKELEEQIPQ